MRAAARPPSGHLIAMSQVEKTASGECMNELAIILADVNDAFAGAPGSSKALLLGLALMIVLRTFVSLRRPRQQKGRQRKGRGAFAEGGCAGQV